MNTRELRVSPVQAVLHWCVKQCCTVRLLMILEGGQQDFVGRTHDLVHGVRDTVENRRYVKGENEVQYTNPRGTLPPTRIRQGNASQSCRICVRPIRGPPLSIEHTRRSSSVAMPRDTAPDGTVYSFSEPCPSTGTEKRTSLPYNAVHG